MTPRHPTSITPGIAAPIGIFDSGLGGLSVLRAIRAELPNEALLYVADSMHAPYGGRDNAFLVARTLAIGQWLHERGAKALVVACNTATAESIAAARAQLSIPVIGVEPGIKPAAMQSKTRVAGVLATQVTLRSKRFASLLARYATDCRFICQAGHGLVEAIERCDTGSPEMRALLARYIEPMIAANADTLVLGCTHYPFLDTTIREITGDRLTLIDTGVAIARQLARVLATNGLLASGQPRPEPPSLCSTGDGKPLRQFAAGLLGLDLPVEQVTIGNTAPAAQHFQAA